MKFLIYTLGTAILALALQHIGPWWLIAVAAIISGFLAQDFSVFKSWIMGALAIFLLWFCWSIFSDMQNEGILSSRIGALFGGLSGIVLSLVTGLIGGIVGGLASMTGRLLRSSLVG